MLRQYVGQPYQQLDKDGMALGCLAPIYLLYPNAPRFKWPRNKPFEKMVVQIKKIFKQVPESEMVAGDILVVYVPANGRHVGVYLGAGEFIHCDSVSGMEVIKLYFLDRAVEGVYRWQFLQELQSGHI